MTPPTPFVVLSAPRVRANITAMQATAHAAGVQLRPHAKTHKSVTIARWQIDAGAVGICCAKLGEAEVFAAGGIADIRVPYPVNPSQADRVLALLDRTRLSVIVDDERVARGWSDAMTAAGRTLDVLVKVDVGTKRCGIDPFEADAPRLVARIAAMPGLSFLGVLSHAGHAYHGDSDAAIAEVARMEGAILSDLVEGVEALGVTVTEISVGSTPSARFIGRQTSGPDASVRVPTEMRPGNYVFRDRTQVALGAATLDDCAMFVEATVVSHPMKNRLILDCGSKTLTNDLARGFTPQHGYGLIVHLDGTPDPSLVIERLSEEHAIVRAASPTRLTIGDRVRVLPNHACVVTNLMDELVLEADPTGVDRLVVDARGRIR